MATTGENTNDLSGKGKNLDFAQLFGGAVFGVAQKTATFNFLSFVGWEAVNSGGFGRSRVLRPQEIKKERLC